MNGRVVLRRAEIPDLPVISAMESRVFADPWSEEALLEEITNPQFACIAAETEGEVCGYFLALCLPGIEIQLCRIAVSESMRRRGIGSLLMDTLIQIGAEIGAEEITLEVRASNAPAIALYRSFGFAEKGLRPAYYENGEDALIMTLDMSAVSL